MPRSDMGGAKTPKGIANRNAALAANRNPGGKKDLAKLDKGETTLSNFLRKNPIARVLPDQGIAGMMDVAAMNPELVSMRDNIEFLDGMILTEAATLDLANCGATFTLLEQILNEEDDPEAFRYKISSAVREGAAVWKKVDRIRALQEDKRKHVETQIKVEDRLKTTLNAQEVGEIAMHLYKIIERLMSKLPEADRKVEAVRIEGEMMILAHGKTIG